MNPSDANPDLPKTGSPNPSLPNADLPEDSLADASNPPRSNASNEGLFPKIIKFDSLARCGEEIWIENNGQIYRLRRTRQGKLILTK